MEAGFDSPDFLCAKRNKKIEDPRYRSKIVDFDDIGTSSPTRFKFKAMDFKKYQKESRKTAIYPKIGKNFIYPTLGLCSEAGEIAGKIKKVLRDEGGKISVEKKELIKEELGDVLWYVAQIASELGLSLEDIAKHNLEKLFSRKARGKLSGSGDKR